MVLSKVLLVILSFILCILFLESGSARPSVSITQDNMWRGYYIPVGKRYFVCAAENEPRIPCYEIFLEDKGNCEIKENKLYCNKPIDVVYE